MGGYFDQPGYCETAKKAGGAAKVKKEEETTVVEANRDRQTLTLTNDSENTIYVFKGKGAKVHEGIRLNKEGGAIVIADYTGVVTAAALVGESVLTYSEV